MFRTKVVEVTLTPGDSSNSLVSIMSHSLVKNSCSSYRDLNLLSIYIGGNIPPPDPFKCCSIHLPYQRHIAGFGYLLE